MFEAAWTGVVAGLLLFLLLSEALRRPAAGWAAENTALLALALALGVVLVVGLVPTDLYVAVRRVALAALSFWIGVKMAFPRRTDPMTQGLRPFGWVLLFVGGLELVFLFV
ncbi:hypothetical protein [Oceanithermus profundus]